MEVEVGLYDIDLVSRTRDLVEFTEEMGIPSIRAIHTLQLEAKLELGGFLRVERLNV